MKFEKGRAFFDMREGRLQRALLLPPVFHR
jgi:hypothetical protein